MPTWKTRIARAKKSGKFTRDDINNTGWNSCAVGEKADWTKTYEMWNDTSPDGLGGGFDGGDALTILGYAFTSAVITQDVRLAEKVYNQIHRVMRGEAP